MLSFSASALLAESGILSGSSFRSDTLTTSCCGGRSKAYMHMLEDVLIRLLQDFGLQAGRRDRCTGVWIADRKIAALGVHISRGVTMHGFALNVVNDLRPYDWIVPCGIEGCKVTSMAEELGADVGLPWVSDRLCGIFAKTFGLQFQQELNRPRNRTSPAQHAIAMKHQRPLSLETV